jgi:CubicO group peptidase (beta-lactamase class C family)
MTAASDVDALDVAALDAYLRERTDADLFTGVVRIDQDAPDGTSRTLLEQGYGFASRAWQVPCTPDIRFDNASNTKLFTAVAALQQVDAGSFTLDTPVIEYLGYAGTQIPATVTPYHLLTHTSGIADDADEDAGERYEDLFVDKPNYALRQTVDILPNFVHKRPNFAPGESTRYCNVAYVLLGLMVERATGMTYRDYVAKHVFAPAGMNDATFASSDIVTPRIAEGADPVRDESGTLLHWHRNVFSYPPVGAPDGGAHVTANDVVAFHRALVGGRLLSPELTAQMLKPHEVYRARGTGTHRTGFGFEFLTDQNGDVECYWKEGINVGVSATLTYYPSSRVTLVILSSMEDGAWEPLHEVDRMLGIKQADPDTIT